MLMTNLNCPTELMNIALQAEREAIRRYNMLAVRMREGNNIAAASLFERMVNEEREHESLLLKWMANEDVEETENILPMKIFPMKIFPVKWHDPHVSTAYNEEACNSYHSTPYRALAFAVHNEEIAFAFYSHVAAHSQNEKVRQHAEILAREELGHAALLRVERRKAFHAEQDNHKQEPVLDIAAINNKIDLLAVALHIDRYLSEQMRPIKNSIPEINSLIIKTQQQIKENETFLNEQKNNFQLTPSKTINANLKKIKQYNIYMQQKFNQSDQDMSRLWACCDRSFVFYDSIVESTDDEQVMLMAQHLTSISLDRIEFLKLVLTQDKNNENKTA